MDFALRLRSSHTGRSIHLWFQSLFWWILHCDVCHILFNGNNNLFQSLFWWILHCDKMEILFSLRILCFNPCFDGFCIATSTTMSFTFPWKKFQSLFWWILHCDICENFKSSPYNKVSILVLMDFALRLGIGGWEFMRDKFQSLFWWILHCDDIYRLCRCNADVSFNPCFDGFCIATATHPHNAINSNWFQSLFWWILHCDVIYC